MPTLLSIDVGIKNLSFCFFDTDKKIIVDWGIINLSQAEEQRCHCDKLAKFKTLQNQVYCGKHKPKSAIVLDKKFAEIEKVKPSLFKKVSFVLQENIKTKEEWLSYLSRTPYLFLCPISENASEMNLVNISRNIQTNFDHKLWNQTPIDIVIIENQISPLASRMKTIQGMITQYFVKTVPEICFVNSCNKLKTVIKEKLTYAERKKKGVAKCRELLCDFSEWISFFESSKKKDDLSDCFLQGRWFIENKMNKTIC
jgi:hypothetical protein